MYLVLPTHYICSLTYSPRKLRDWGLGKISNMLNNLQLFHDETGIWIQADCLWASALTYPLFYLEDN